MSKLRLLVDENMSPTLADALRAVGIDARAVRELGKLGTSDIALFEYMGRQAETFVLISHNWKMLLNRNKAEIAAANRAKVGILFFPTNPQLSVFRQLALLLTHWEGAIAEQLRTPLPWTMDLTDAGLTVARPRPRSGEGKRKKRGRDAAEIRAALEEMAGTAAPTAPDVGSTEAPPPR